MTTTKPAPTDLDQTLAHLIELAIIDEWGRTINAHELAKLLQALAGHKQPAIVAARARVHNLINIGARYRKHAEKARALATFANRHEPT
jgi:hypothetical protein